MAGPVSRSGGLAASFLSVTPSVTSLYEGTAVTFTVNTFAVPNNTTAYYTINQISGTVGTATFTSASLSGSFILNNNTGSFTLTTNAEDGNSTDDTFTVDIRETSITGSVKLTSAQIKVVDLTTYNSALATYNNGFGGQTLTYAIGASSTGAGNKTTATFQGTTITANGGAVGTSGATYAAGGTFSGGDGGVAGGQGMFGTAWIGNGGRTGYWTAGGGAGAGNNPGGTPAQDMGAWVGTTTGTDARMNYLLSFITSMGWTVNTSGPARTYNTIGNFSLGVPGNYFAGGGGGGAATQNLTASNGSYNKASGGAGGPMGGGGGGGGVASITDYLGNYTYTVQAGGAGGAGGVFVQYDNIASGAMITTGVSRTIPAGVKQVKVWAIGGGGAGKSSTSSITTGVYGGQCGGGGGAGGMVWKTWTYAGTAPTKPSL